MNGKIKEIVEDFKNAVEDFKTAIDELLEDSFDFEDIEELEKDGVLVPSPESTLNSVTSDKSRKSKAPGGPINKMLLFFYRTIKKYLIEKKENIDNKFEQNAQQINASIQVDSSIKKMNKDLIATVKLKDASNKLKSAIEKVEEREEKVEAEIQEKIEKREAEKLEKETQKDIDSMFKTMKSIEDSQLDIKPISVEPVTEEQILSDSEQNLAYMVNAIKNNEEKEQKMQHIVTEPAEEKEVEEKNEADLFEDFIATIKDKTGAIAKETSYEISDAINKAMIKANDMVISEAAKMCTKLSTELVNEKQSHMQDLESKEAEWQKKYSSLEQKTNEIIDKKDKDISALEITLNESKALIDQKDKRIVDQEDQIKSKDEEIARLTDRLAMLEKNNSALEAEVIRLQPYEEKFSSLQNMFVPQQQAVGTEEPRKTL